MHIDSHSETEAMPSRQSVLSDPWVQGGYLYLSPPEIPSASRSVGKVRVRHVVGHTVHSSYQRWDSDAVKRVEVDRIFNSVTWKERFDRIQLVSD